MLPRLESPVETLHRIQMPSVPPQLHQPSPRLIPGNTPHISAPIQKRMAPIRYHQKARSARPSPYFISSKAKLPPLEPKSAIPLSPLCSGEIIDDDQLSDNDYDEISRYAFLTSNHKE